MKKLLLISVIAATGLMLSSVGVQAEEEETERDRIIQRKTDKAAELNGHAWEIEISGPGDFSGSDVLTFQNKQFKSAIATELGYPPSNYSVFVKNAEATEATWETMQSIVGEEITFWRGSWEDDKMTGAITRQIKDTEGNIVKTETHYYKSLGSQEIPETAEVDEEETMKRSSSKISPSVLSSDSSGEKKKKKKSSWF